jgi:hypothetical protein
MHKSSVATPKPYIKTKESSNRGIFSSNSVQEHTSFTRNSTQVNSQQSAEGGLGGERGIDRIAIYIELDPDSVVIHDFLSRLRIEGTSGSVKINNLPEVHIRWISGAARSEEQAKLRLEFNPSSIMREQGYELCPFSKIQEICRNVMEIVVLTGDPQARFAFQEVNHQTGEINPDWPSNWANQVLCTRVDLTQDFVIDDPRYKLAQLKFRRPKYTRAAVNYINGRKINTVTHKSSPKHWTMKIYDKCEERKSNPKDGTKPLTANHTRFEVSLKYIDLKNSGLLKLNQLTESRLDPLLEHHWDNSTYGEPLFSDEHFMSVLIDGGLSFEQASALFYFLYVKENGLNLPKMPDRYLRELRKSAKSFGIRLSEGLHQSSFSYGYLDILTGTLVVTAPLLTP